MIMNFSSGTGGPGYAGDGPRGGRGSRVWERDAK